MDPPSSTRYVEGSLRFSPYTTSMHRTNEFCRIVGEVNSPMRVDAQSCMNVFGTSDRASIIDDKRCGMSDVTFHAAPSIGGLSC